MSIEKSKNKNLLNELVSLIEETKTQVISSVNSSLTLLFLACWKPNFNS